MDSPDSEPLTVTLTRSCDVRGATEVPTDETLTAIFDRFLLRIRSDNLDAYHFQDLLTKGVQHEIMALTDRANLFGALEYSGGTFEDQPTAP